MDPPAEGGPVPRLGDQLVESGLVTMAQLHAALEKQRASGGFLTDILLAAGTLKETPYLAFLAGRLKTKYITAEKLAKVKVPDELTDRLPVREAERLTAMPLSLDSKGVLTVVVADLEPGMAEQIQAAAQVGQIVPVLALRRAVQSGIQQLYYRDPYAFEWVGRPQIAAKVQTQTQTAATVVARVEAPVLGSTTGSSHPGVAQPYSPVSLDPLRKLQETIEAQQREIRMLRVANDLSLHLTHERDFGEMLHRVLAFCFDNLPADEGAILLADPTTHRLTPHSVRTRLPDQPEVSISQTLLAEIETTQKGVLTTDAADDPRFRRSETVVTARMRSAIGVPLIIQGRVGGAIVLATRGTAGMFSEADLQICSAIAAQAGVALENLLLTQRLTQDAEIRSRLSRFLSPALVELASSGALDLKEAGHLQTATVLFADIRSFTSLAERLGPQQVVALLNEHFEAMVEVVFSQGGVLDKFIGDALMALWGVPHARPGDPARALTAALQMISRVEQMNQARTKAGKETLQIGIGINTGPVVFGAMGASRRLELTTVGDQVNVAARLCDLAQGGQVVVSQSALEAAGGGFPARQLPLVTLKGKSKATTAFVLDRLRR